VNIKDKEILFIRTRKTLKAWVLAENPKLYISWYSNQIDFKLNLTAQNSKSQSEAYQILFNVLESNETVITPTKYFNKTEISKLGHFKTQ
jgi:hypothetical protein